MCLPTVIFVGKVLALFPSTVGEHVAYCMYPVRVNGAHGAGRNALEGQDFCRRRDRGRLCRARGIHRRILGRPKRRRFRPRGGQAFSRWWYLVALAGQFFFSPILPPEHGCSSVVPKYSACVFTDLLLKAAFSTTLDRSPYMALRGVRFYPCRLSTMFLS